MIKKSIITIVFLVILGLTYPLVSHASIQPDSSLAVTSLENQILSLSAELDQLQNSSGSTTENQTSTTSPSLYYLFTASTTPSIISSEITALQNFLNYLK